jgi:hypothetical protein
MERIYKENIVGIRKMTRKTKKVKYTNLTDLFGNFAYTIQETLIRYLVIGPSDRIDIFDLDNIKAECDFEFDLREIGNINSFEYHNVDLVLKGLLSGENRYMKFADLVKIIKSHFTKNNNSVVINYLNDNYKFYKEQYKFIKYDTGVQVTIYSPHSRLIVQLEEDTDLEIFSNLETEYDKLPQIDNRCRSITVEQYTIISYCVNNLR